MGCGGIAHIVVRELTEGCKCCQFNCVLGVANIGVEPSSRERARFPASRICSLKVYWLNSLHVRTSPPSLAQLAHPTVSNMMISAFIVDDQSKFGCLESRHRASLTYNENQFVAPRNTTRGAAADELGRSTGLPAVATDNPLLIVNVRKPITALDVCVVDDSKQGSQDSLPVRMIKFSSVELPWGVPTQYLGRCLLCDQLCEYLVLSWSPAAMTGSLVINL